MGSLSLAVLFLFAAAPSNASDAPKPVSASGYLKELWQYSRSAFDGRPYFLNTGRARLTLDANTSVFKAHADYDHEVLAGSFFRTFEYKVFGLGEPPSWLTMDQTISTGATNIYRHRLYRGWAGVESDRGTLRFGRQRIAWGTGKLWNPTDVLNPYQPTTVERDERRGVDAVYGRYGLGNLSQAELAWSQQDRWPDHSLLARLKTNVKDYDLSVMGGKLASSTDSWMVGGDFAGNLLDGTLHAEWSYTDLKVRTPFWKADLGYDYTFPTETKLWLLRDSTVVAEYFHSGSGVLDRRSYDFTKLFGGREVTVAQDYMGLTYSKDLHTLLKLEFSLITNLDDGSGFYSPSLQYNALNNLYLSGGFQRFGGGRGTEFGHVPNLGFLQAQYYF
ncbi:MAG: hypothetical protein HY077_08220 [Elusimicrobia bacterium]|nr:hypothetical protein [Elusimicrobiota bacterium]